VPPINRKSAMRVRGGRVAKKNNWTPDHKNFYARPQSEIQIERTDPGPGYRHVVTVAQLRQFLAILPDWEELAIGLNVISISSGNEEWDGLSEPGAVVITAWTADLWWWVRRAWAEHNAELLALLEVESAPLEKNPKFVELRWTDAQARAYKLLSRSSQSDPSRRRIGSRARSCLLRFSKHFGEKRRPQDGIRRRCNWRKGTTSLA
jgi:hypothetical protein